MDTTAKTSDTAKNISKRYRSILIEPVLNGFIVQVGCQKCVFLSLTAIADALEQYEEDPQGMENLYQAKSKSRDSGGITRLEPANNPLTGLCPVPREVEEPYNR